MKSQAVAARDRQRLERAAVDLAARGGREVKKQIHAPAQQVLVGRLGAAVRHMHQLDAGQLPERRRQHMLARTITTRCVGQLARIGLGIGHQFFKAVAGQVFARHQRVAVSHRQAHRLEIAQAVIRQVAVQPGVDRHIGNRADQQRVAVRRGLGHRIGAHQRARTRTVFNHHGLADLFAQSFCHQAAHKVKAATRWLRHHHLDRLGRESLRADARVKARQGKQTAGQHATVKCSFVHVSVSSLIKKAVAQRSKAPPANQRAPRSYSA